MDFDELGLQLYFDLQFYIKEIQQLLPKVEGEASIASMVLPPNGSEFSYFGSRANNLACFNKSLESSLDEWHSS